MGNNAENWLEGSAGLEYGKVDQAGLGDVKGNPRRVRGC